MTLISSGRFFPAGTRLKLMMLPYALKKMPPIILAASKMAMFVRPDFGRTPLLLRPDDTSGNCRLRVSNPGSPQRAGEYPLVGCP